MGFNLGTKQVNSRVKTARLQYVSTFRTQFHTCASLQIHLIFVAVLLNMHLTSFTLHCILQNNKKHVQDLWKDNSAGVLKNAVGRIFFF